MAPSAYSNEDYSTLFFLQQPVKLDPRITVLKIFHDYYGTFFLICSYFLPIFFSIFHNIVIIIFIIPEIGVLIQQKVRKKKACFNTHAGGK